jgi:hypothetical protein
MSVFDPTTFLETQHAGNLDTRYVLPDEGDYLAQVTDKITLRTGRRTDDNSVWAAMTLQCELIDCDAMKKKLNMERIFVNFDMFLDLLPESTEDAPRLDMGTNRNMRLKRLYEAAGINRNKQIAPSMLKFTTITAHVEHEQDRNDPEVQYAKVTRAASAEKMRMAAQ